MRKSALSAIFLSFSVFLCGQSWAMHASVGTAGGHAGPITTAPGILQPRGMLSVVLQAEHIDYDLFSDNRLLEFASQDKEIHNVDSLTVYSLHASYGIMDNLSAHLSIPYVVRENVRESEPPDEIHLHGDSRGIGDATARVRYRIIDLRDRGFTSAVSFGIKMPTGDTSERDLDGMKFAPEFQPGSGSWDFSFGIAASKSLGRLTADANLLYTVTTEGTQNTDLGDIISYNASISSRVLSGEVGLDLIIEANGVYRQKEETAGVKDENSGGNVIFLSPGIRATAFGNLAGYLSVGFPIVEDLNGDQNDTNYRAVLGVAGAF